MDGEARDVPCHIAKCSTGTASARCEFSQEPHLAMRRGNANETEHVVEIRRRAYTLQPW
jgi:hypothetical protein